MCIICISMWNMHFCLVNALIHSCETVNIYTVWKHWNVIVSLQMYMLKHAAAPCCKNNHSLHYSNTSLHHAPTDNLTLQS